MAGRALTFSELERGIEAEWGSESAQEDDVMSIRWLLTQSVHRGLTLSVLPMIEEVRWPVWKDLTPILEELLFWLYSTLDRSDPFARMAVEPSQEDKAISVAKAVLCLSYAIPQEYLPSLPGVGIRFADSGAPLNFLLDEICERFEEGQRKQQRDSVPETLIYWATHFILLKLFAIDDVLQCPEELLEQAFNIGISALVIRPLPSNKVLANALVAIAVSLGIDADKEDAFLTDKSRAIGTIVRVICSRIGVILSHKAMSLAEGTPNGEMRRACRLVLPMFEFYETKMEALVESHRVLAALTPQVVRRANSLKGISTGTSLEVYTERWTTKVSNILLRNHDEMTRSTLALAIAPAVWEEIKAENVIFSAEVIQRLAELTHQHADSLTESSPGAYLPIDNLKGNIKASSEFIAQGGYQAEKEEQAKGMLQVLDTLLLHDAIRMDSSGENAGCSGEPHWAVEKGKDMEASGPVEGQN
ncbi:hypothetical protein FRC01_009010 [Tulasnella sp. 417]|nr:hypothetical protein FRC01_009010 [Tulasnella sp. 417]